MPPASAFNARRRSRRANFQPIGGIRCLGGEFAWSAAKIESVALVIDEEGRCILQPKSGRKQMHSANASTACPDNVADAGRRKLKVFSQRVSGPRVWAEVLVTIVIESGVGSATRPKASKTSHQACGK